MGKVGEYQLSIERSIQQHRRGLVCFEQKVQWIRLELENVRPWRSSNGPVGDKDGRSEVEREQR